MKLIIEQDEANEVYSIVSPYNWSEVVHDLPDDLYSEYLSIQYKYNKMQNHLRELYDQSREKKTGTS
jgi:hypothetical protein